MRVVSADLPARAELVVVGGGIVGAATAFHAARAGIETLLVERLPAPAAFTTAVATGGYRLQLEHREELDLHPAIAANPLIAFTTVATDSGTLSFQWTGDKGYTLTETATITVV